MKSVIITSINHPTRAILEIGQVCERKGLSCIVIGDEKSPRDFFAEGCSFYSIEAQLNSGLRFADACPTRHYARKNIGYLLAIRNGVTTILETDDDNIPLSNFWEDRSALVKASSLNGTGWTNVYKYFSEHLIWPRGLPLDEVNAPLPEYETLPAEEFFCPIQQGLADDNPDVDAIYRLLLPLPIKFRTDRSLVLKNNTWCPFNSQNTSWWTEAYPLLYLPSFCSFRMTDIWRSLIAQRILWLNDWYVLFHEPTVFQERNEHNLMRDFEDEISGYLNNRKIADALMELPLRVGEVNISDNLRICYEKLVQIHVMQKEELMLLDLWLDDLSSITDHRHRNLTPQTLTNG
ncbi:MAG: DUF288 domain-containing protein [Cyanobacteria bacterium CRU_2_1]|nr:DUF288 domain-containing protein [Cyanobacteria bacterium RU_5_0]NJR57772.1 DUF288 domain-containing protein [Cyanobacteria bacterium CRU_2_1]